MWNVVKKISSRVDKIDNLLTTPLSKVSLMKRGSEFDQTVFDHVGRSDKHFLSNNIILICFDGDETGGSRAGF